MDTFKFVSTVEATFVSGAGDVFVVNTDMLNKIVEAPKWIRSTMMFKYMMASGYVQIINEEKPIEITEISDHAGASEVMDEQNGVESEKPPEEPKNDESNAPTRKSRTSRTQKGDES